MNRTYHIMLELRVEVPEDGFKTLCAEEVGGAIDDCIKGMQGNVEGCLVAWGFNEPTPNSALPRKETSSWHYGESREAAAIGDALLDSAERKRQEISAAG